jgi:hypothetical protein
LKFQFKKSTRKENLDIKNSWIRRKLYIFLPHACFYNPLKEDVMEEEAQASSLKPFLILVSVVILFILLVGGNNLSNGELFKWIVVVVILVVLFGIGYMWRKVIPLIIIFAILLLVGSMTTEFLNKWKMPFYVEVDNTTTFVEAPANIEDPTLRDYEMAKMGFEENWFVKTMGGVYGGLAGAYILSLLMQIGASRNKLFFVLEHWSLDAVVFAIGMLSLYWAFKPNYAPDQATAQASNTAFFIALIGPLLWSLVMQGLSIAIRFADESTGTVNNIYYSYFIGMISYPLVAGLFSIFNLDLVDAYVMSDKLVNTAITIQRWEEIKILGKFCGLFGPPAVIWAFTTTAYFFGWRPDD